MTNLKKFNLPEDSLSYKKMIKNKCKYSSKKKVLNRSNSSFAVTVNGNYIQLVEFVYSQETGIEKTICNKIITDKMMIPHQNWTHVLFCEKPIEISEDLDIIDTELIKLNCVFVDNKKEKFIFPVSNMQ